MTVGSKDSVLIIGGGVSGMSAARILDSLDIKVHLVEKSDHLGGKVREWACMATDKCQYCGACLGPELVDRMYHLKNTMIYLECQVTGINKKNDGFRIAIKGKTNTDIDVKAILLANGLDLFNPGDLKNFEYDKNCVITTARLNTILRKEGLPEILSHNKSPSIAFIQCVGSRNREIGLDYCSQVCCKTSLRQANKILHLIPDASITMFHMDLQILGKMFRNQFHMLENRLMMIQGIPAKILTSTENGRLKILHEDPETGLRTSHDFDMVVLAVGMKASPDTKTIAEKLGIETGEWGFIYNDNTTYQRGIFSAGTVNGPMDILTAVEQGVAAANEISRLIKKPGQPSKKNIVVLGGGEEGRRVSSAMADGEYNIIFLDEESNAYDNDRDINVYLGCRLVEISGTAGQFHISVESEEKEIVIDAAAVIVANGTQKKSLSSDKVIPHSNSIIPLSQFHRTYNNNDEIPENITFWLDHNGPEWKNNSRKVLLLAVDLSENGKNVSIILEKMLVHGLKGQRIYDRARRSGIKFLRVSSPSDVDVKQEDATLKIEVKEATLSGISVNVPCDLLIVPETVNPCSNNSIYANLLNDTVDEEDFMQSPNIRHRRIGSPRKGVFFAGSCHDETDESDLKHETRVIKASIDLLVSDSDENENTAVIDKGKCARCLTCFRICPHHAIVLDDQQPFIKKEACFGCGLCISSCPSVAIFKEQDRDDKEREKSLSETIVFACERSAFLAEKDLRRENSDINGYTVIPIDCTCSLDSRIIMECLFKGASRIMVMGCHKDNCRSMIGDRHAYAKISRVLNETGISPSVLTYHPIAANEPVRLGQLIQNKSLDQKEATNG